MVSGSFSLPCSGFFSPFPHGTGSLSVSQEYLALADGPAGFIQGFTCPALLRIPLSKCSLPIPGYHRLWPLFPKRSSSLRKQWRGPTTPLLPRQQRFGLIRFRSPLLSESLIIFSSSGYLDVSVLRVRSLKGDWSSTSRVAPFGNLRIKGYVHLLVAYRSLSRPSSPLQAKASAVCS